MYLKYLSFNILLAAFMLTLGACSKNDNFVVSPVKQFKPFEINGFVLGEPLDQYFDGVKTRELRGVISLNWPATTLAFTSDETTMELRKKDGEVVYRQTFHIKDELNKVPAFYYDGAFQSKYTYPVPQGLEHLANFYFDVPKDSAAADVVMVIVEYYFDWNDMDNPIKELGTTTFPIASNIRAGWSQYITLSKPPELPKQHPDSEFQPMVCLKRAGTNEFYIDNNRDKSSFSLSLPNKWSTEGTVQSVHLAFDKTGRAVPTNLVQIFPR